MENPQRLFLSSSASFPSSVETVWTAVFHDFCQRIRRSFQRPETYLHALAYLQGLMSEAKRKNGWQMAEEAGEATPYAMQHLLNRAKWNCDGVRDELRTYIGEMLADPKGVVVIDETGFLKKGCKSVGVQRQYGGTHRKLPGGRISFLRQFTWTRLTGSRIVFAQELD